VPSDFLRCGALWEELNHRGLLHCTGKIERTVALQIVSEGDILVMPSVDDGMANALLEGMALGLCPVVTDVFTDVVDPNCGYIVERNSRKLLAEAFVAAAGAPEMRQRLGRHAQERVLAQHQPKREAEAYRDLLEACVATP
jgi:colanic acid/amylovoran biosynthesis glycosyltransferase